MGRVATEVREKLQVSQFHPNTDTYKLVKYTDVGPTPREQR